MTLLGAFRQSSENIELYCRMNRWCFFSNPIFNFRKIWLKSRTAIHAKQFLHFYWRKFIWVATSAPHLVNHVVTLSKKCLTITERVSGKIMQNVKKCPEARFSNPQKLMFDGKVYAWGHQNWLYFNITMTIRGIKCNLESRRMS